MELGENIFKLSYENSIANLKHTPAQHYNLILTCPFAPEYLSNATVLAERSS